MIFTEVFKMLLDVLEVIHLRQLVENDFKLRNEQLALLEKDDKDVNGQPLEMS